MRARVDIAVAPLALLASLGVSVLAAGFSGGLWTVSFQALYGSLHVPFVIAVLPVVALGVALLLVAVLARRWGWVVAAAGVAGQLVLTLRARELAVVFHPIGLEIVYAAGVGGTLGGLAAAFGVAGRWARLGIGAGLALGLVAARAVVFVLNNHTNPLAAVTFGLCAVVAAVSLADWPAAPIAWDWRAALVGSGIVVVGAAVVAALLHLPLGFQSNTVTIIELVSTGVLVAAGLSLAATLLTARGAESASGVWVVVAFAVGYTAAATNLTQPSAQLGLPPGLGGSVWESGWMAILVAVLGAVAGVGLRRWAPRVPWEVPLLLVLLVGTWLARRGPATWGRLFAVWPPAYQLVLIFAAAAALAVTAIAVTSWSGLALGLVAFVFADWTGPFGEVFFAFSDRLLAIVLGVAVLGAGALRLRDRQPERV